MDYLGIILIALAVFIVLLVTGNYVNVVLFGAGIVGIYLIGGTSLLEGFLTNDPYRTGASYSLTTIPLYVIMAQFIMRAGIIRDFYAIVFKTSRGRKSALGILTVLLGGFLGAVSGSGTATAASLGQISVPELRSRGYSDGLAGTVAATSGSLSAIIPPSIMLIVYGVITQISVGQLFMAAFIPGAIMMGIFMVLTILFLTTKKEKNNPNNQEISSFEDVELPIGRTLVSLMTGIAILLIIFVGIYSGFFTPTEAGAVGAFVAMIVALARRSLTVESVKEATLETVKVTGMTLVIIIAASIFGRFVTLSLLPRYLITLFEPLLDTPAALLCVILVIYYIMFMFLDGTATVLMTVPIFLPIIEMINVDIMWFGVFVCMLCTLGALTPPVGFCVYAVGGITKIPISTIFKYAMVYAVVTTIVLGGLMIAFPELALWLPSTMK